jgi:hypothetical protein
MTISAGTREKLRRATDLLRHSIPDGDPGAVFDRALTMLLEHLEKTRLAAAKHPRTSALPAGDSSTQPRPKSRSRHIPAAVKREVWARDEGRCAFVGNEGRCPETGRLEFHHKVPYAAGGEATVANLALACKSHNNHEAARFFGSFYSRFGGDATGCGRSVHQLRPDGVDPPRLRD